MIKKALRLSLVPVLAALLPVYAISCIDAVIMGRARQYLSLSFPSLWEALFLWARAPWMVWSGYPSAVSLPWTAAYAATVFCCVLWFRKPGLKTALALFAFAFLSCPTIFYILWLLYGTIGHS